MLLRIALFSISLLFVTNTAYSICDSKDDGDCCQKDSECGAFFHPMLCAVIPLNKTAIAKLQSEDLKLADFCQKSMVEKLTEDAKAKKPKCFDQGCEFDEDNG